ncbi:salivary glue protein Sgs-3-like [Euwallacea fornicatus]|uniref:salivary glue protein Sgs-3-like n=1 Tax=Euwallacea fornicatus TaxID=995702 RepID=UPI00338E5C1E
MLKTSVILGLVVFCRVGQADVGAGRQPPCPSDGSVKAYYATNNCAYFWQCSNGVPHLMPCAPGTHWDQSLWTCVHIHQSTCTGEGWSSTEKPAPTTTRRRPTWRTTTKATITSAPGSCPLTDGPASVYFPHQDPTKFWQCSNGVPHQHSCPSGLHFNPTLNVCDWPNNGTSPTTRRTTTRRRPTWRTTTKATTTSAPGNCPLTDGPDSVYFPHQDPTKFWQCSNGVPHQHSCPSGLHFNSILNVCDWPNDVTSSTTRRTTTRRRPTWRTTTKATTTSAPGNCPLTDGPDSVYFPHQDPTKFWQCSNGVPHQHSCPSGLHFNSILNVCDWPNDVKSSTTRRTTTRRRPTWRTTTKATTTSAPGNCPLTDGPDSVYFPHQDPTKFWQCSNGVPYQHNCPSGLHFNRVLNLCS